MMNKYWIVTIAIMLMAGTSVAQQFHGGVMAGLVGSQVAGDNFSGFKKAGIFAGGFVYLDISEKSSIQMELTYFQKGSRENPTEKNGYTSYLLRLNYIEMPILYQFQTGRFKIFGGPSAGFSMGYYEKDTYLNVISDDPGYIKPAKVTLQINVGVRLQIAPKIFVDLRTNNSLINVFSQNQTGDVRRFWSYGRYNDALALSVFYQFR